jgi:N-acylneuraminate cytidylyltransferase
MFQPEHFTTRSQDLEDAWHDAGQFYWGRAKAWTSGRPIFGPDSIPVRLPRHRVQDIDTLEDWQRAEWMLRAMTSTQDAGA